MSPGVGLVGWRPSADRTRLHCNSLLTGNFTGNFAILARHESFLLQETAVSSRLGRDLFSPIDFQVEDEMSPVRERYGEAFWRAHHEAWVESELNQREYCEAYGIPLKAFGNWRAKFKAEPQQPARKMLYRRRGLSHALSHGLSHGLSHDLRPTIPPAREGRRRKFSEADKRQILEQAILPDACFAEVARRYGIAERVLFRWKQELTQVAPLFMAVEIVDATPPTEEHTS
jgi:hypothetical protein